MGVGAPGEEAMQPCSRQGGAEGKEGLEKQHDDPDAVLGCGSGAVQGPGDDPAGGEEQRDLPEGVQQIGRDPALEAWRGALPFAFDRCECANY